MKMCVPYAVFLLVPGLLAWTAFDPIFREKVVEMERDHPTENFHLGLDAYHTIVELSTDRSFRVNVKQSMSICGQWSYFDGFCDQISPICVVLRGNFAYVFARLVSPVCNGGQLNRGSRIQRNELFDAS